MEFQEKLTDGYYHVMAGEKEISRHRTLSAAKKRAEANPGSMVCTDEGVCVYPEGIRTGNNIPTRAGPEYKYRTAVLKSLMNVRKAPSLDAEIIRTLPAGETVEVEGVIDSTKYTDSWLRVRLGNEDAYILYSGGKYAELRD